MPKFPEKNPGRQAQLTPAIYKAIIRLVEKGNWTSTAARAVGIRPHTMSRWLQRGRGEHPSLKAKEPYVSFVKDVETAIAKAESRLVDDLGGQEDWRAKAGLLERGPSRERWSQEITISAQLAPAASILDTLRNRSLTESKEGLEPLEVEVKEISNAEGGT